MVGLIFTLQISILNWGTRLTLAGRATVILHTYPVSRRLLKVLALWSAVEADVFDSDALIRQPEPLCRGSLIFSF